MNNDTVILVSRVLLSILFLVAGFNILSNPGGYAGYMAAVGFPLPTVVAWLVVALKILGGIAILVGFQTRWAAYALAAFCVATAFIGHFNFADATQASLFMKNLGLAGGFLLLSVIGPGALSVDAKRGGA